MGEDILQNIEIKRADLRYQCEREFKTKLVALRQAYLQAAGDRKVLSENIIASIPAYIPLFRAIIFLFGKEPPINNDAVLAALHEVSNIDTGAFRAVLSLKKERSRISMQALNTLFRDFYNATEKLGDMTDAAVE